MNDDYNTLCLYLIEHSSFFKSIKMAPFSNSKSIALSYFPLEQRMAFTYDSSQALWELCLEEHHEEFSSKYLFQLCPVL